MTDSKPLYRSKRAYMVAKYTVNGSVLLLAIAAVTVAALLS